MVVCHVNATYDWKEENRVMRSARIGHVEEKGRKKQMTRGQGYQGRSTFMFSFVMMTAERFFFLALPIVEAVRPMTHCIPFMPAKKKPSDNNKAVHLPPPCRQYIPLAPAVRLQQGVVWTQDIQHCFKIIIEPHDNLPSFAREIVRACGHAFRWFFLFCLCSLQSWTNGRLSIKVIKTRKTPTNWPLLMKTGRNKANWKRGLLFLSKSPVYGVRAIERGSQTFRIPCGRKRGWWQCTPFKEVEKVCSRLVIRHVDRFSLSRVFASSEVEGCVCVYVCVFCF